MVTKRIVAITGGGGFIGKPLVEKHLRCGDEVRLLSRKGGGDDDAIRYFQADLTDAASIAVLQQFVDGADILYHCAGELYDEVLMERLHVGGMQRLLQVAKGRVGRWVQLSSVGAYGPCRRGTVDEMTPEQPQGVYEKSKTEADRLLRESGLEYSMLRPSIVFGKSMTNRSMAQMASMIRRGLFFYVGRGARVSYVHVDDVVEALMLCGQKPEAVGKTYILSGSTTLEQMVDALAGGIGAKAPKLRLPQFPVRLMAKLFGSLPGFPLTESRLDALTGRCRYDSSTIERELGFSFHAGLEEAFRRYAESVR